MGGAERFLGPQRFDRIRPNQARRLCRGLGRNVSTARDEMKVLTVRQPWASLIICGAKNVENRNWSTEHRGLMLIHAALEPAPPLEWERARELLEQANADPEAIKQFFDAAGLESERGVILGSVVLDAVWQNPYCSPWASEDFRYQWVLKNSKQFPSTVPVKGRLGLWNWDEQYV